VDSRRIDRQPAVKTVIDSRRKNKRGQRDRVAAGGRNDVRQLAEKNKSG